MKKIFILLVFLISFSYANVNSVVSIQPLVTFVEKIGKDKVNISLMVKPGNSPHTYEPKPSQMRDISNADIYFAIGVEFENIWLKRFKNQNPSLHVVHLDDGIEKIHMQEHHEHNHEIHHDKEESYDPHIWLSPKNVKVIAKKIYLALSSQDKKNEQFYKKNLEAFLEEINKTDLKIREILKDVKSGSKFMVFHPSWGYFARDYNLEQIAVEVEGKSIKPKTLINIIKIAKKEKIKAILTQPEFSDKIAKTLANELKIKVLKISPLNKDWSNNLIKLSKAIK
jgi:zinc transport system substrate-binding protein